MKPKRTRSGFYAERGAALTQEILKSALLYDPDTGVFTRKIDWHRFTAGSVAGASHPNGYLYISVNRTKTVAHRLAWLYMTGAMPDCDIDHVNGDKADNRWSNLREARGSINSENQRRAHRNSKTGFLGVTRNSKSSWAARIKVKGKMVHIGSFSDPQSAHQAYLDAKRKYHEGCSI